MAPTVLHQVCPSQKREADIARQSDFWKRFNPPKVTIFKIIFTASILYKLFEDGICQMVIAQRAMFGLQLGLQI